MGFCYDSRGRLCCDKCGKAPARKKACPAGWCQATALCPECKAAPGFGELWKSWHTSCPARSAEFAAKQAHERELLEGGAFVRCSALTAGAYGVHVLFRNNAGKVRGFYMAAAVYDALPLGEAHTPDDYRKHGELTPAPDDFDRGQGSGSKELTGPAAVAAFFNEHPEIAHANAASVAALPAEQKDLFT